MYIYIHKNYIISNDLLSSKAFNNPSKDLDCNIVNKIYANLGPATVVNFPSSRFHYNKYFNQNKHFFMTNASMQELRNVIHSFPNKSSAGFDGLSIKLLKLVYLIISKPLLLLKNKSFTSGFFPDLLKIARVVSIFKSGSPNELINYRSLSI